jgi:ATP-dependent Zn protease
MSNVRRHDFTFAGVHLKKLAPFVLCVFGLLSNAANACSDAESAKASVDNLSVTANSFSLSEADGRRMITTLGSMKNSSEACFDSVVVEVKYLDAKNSVIDTITQPLYGVVAPPSAEVAFRVRDEAANAKEAYASQVIRVVSAEPRKASRGTKAQSGWSTFADFLVSWGPMLLLIGVWVFFMQRMKRKDSPQGRQLALFEQQNAILEAQNGLLARIASASEVRARGQSDA